MVKRVVAKRILSGDGMDLYDKKGFFVDLALELVFGSLWIWLL